MSPKLLIVGDAAFAGQLFERIADSGLEVARAGNFVEALSAVGGASLVVLQNSVAGSDDLCTQLRGDPLTAQLPLVVAMAPGGVSIRVKVNAKIAHTNIDALERAVLRLTGAHGPPAATSPAPAPLPPAATSPAPAPLPPAATSPAPAPLPPAADMVPAPLPPAPLPPNLAPEPVPTASGADEMSLDQLWSAAPSSVPAPEQENGGPDLYGGGSLSEPDSLAPESLDLDDERMERELFDDDQATRVFRRPEALPGEAGEWPPMPPTREEGVNLVDHTQTYAGYVNSIIEALQSPGKLSHEEQLRLLRVSKYTLEDADELLATVQSAVNASLMDKDLVRMRVLSAAKTRIYDKRSTVRTLLAKLKEGLGPVKEEEDSAAALEALLKSSTSLDPIESSPALKPEITGPLDLEDYDGGGWAGTTEPSGSHPIEEPPPGRTPSPPQGTPPVVEPPPVAEESQAPSEPSQPVRVEPDISAIAGDDSDDPLSMDSISGSFSLAKKSKLTLAAEAKDKRAKDARVAAIKEARERREQARKEAAEKNPAPMNRRGSAAKKRERAGDARTWLLALVGLCLLVGGGLGIRYLWLNRTPAAKKATTTNKPPLMKWVILEQTHAGIVARPQATDPEGDRVSYTIIWYRNGREIQNERTARLRPTAYQAGETVFAEVTPADTFSSGRPMRSQDLVAKRLSRPR